MGSITWVDWGIWMVYFTFIFVVLWIYRSAKQESHYQFFLKAFLFKVLGGLGFTLIYVYYYKFGDTFLYHRGAMVLSDTLIDSPGDYFRLLTSTNANLPPDLADFANSISYSRGAEEWFMVKLLSPIVLLAFKSYLVTTLFMSIISFYGGWKLFLVFQDILPERKNLAFIAVFLIPSSMFWGAGIMKDTFTLAGINIIIYHLYFSLFKGRISISKYAVATFVALIVLSLKGYVIIAFIPGLLLGVSAIARKSAQNIVLSRSLGIVFLVITTAIIYLGPRYLSETSSKYTAASIEGRVKGFHSWHTDIGGATYNLGEIEYTASGVIRKIPSALNVTFFRPYLWESLNPVVFIAALESSFLLGLFLYILVKLKFGIFSLLRERPIVATLVVYCIIFGFIVGFTSYNFGALGRYKIPIYSLFVFVLFYLYSKIQERKGVV